MKKFWFMVPVVLVYSCSQQGDLGRFEKLYDDVVTRGDEQALEEIIKATKSNSRWERIYGYSYLGDVVVNYPKGTTLPEYDLMLEILVTGLEDKEVIIQRAVIERLIGCGSNGVGLGFDKIVAFVMECREDSVGYISAKALAVFVSESHTLQAVEALLYAVKCESTGGQLRETALWSLVDLIDQGHVDFNEIVRRTRQEIEDQELVRRIEEFLAKNIRKQ